RINGNGGFGPMMSVAVPGGQGSCVLATSETGHVYVGGADGTIGCFSADAQGRLRAGGSVADGGGIHLADPVGMETVTVGGREYLVVLSGSESGVSVLGISPGSGALSQGTSLGAQNGLGIQNVPVALDIAQIGGRSFVVVASMDS